MPGGVSEIVLDVAMRDEKIYGGVANVTDGTAVFLLEMRKEEDSYETIMDFNVSYTVVKGD